MAEMALKDGNAFSNPRKGNEQEIAAIFRRGILSVNEGPSCRFHRRGVRLFYDPRGHHAGAINELCWGLEEQGVPCQTITYDGGGDAAALGALAARSSPLRVGIGLSASGEIALTHAQLPADAPLATGHVTDSDDHLRTLGANAGQLVKVLPLSERN